MGYTREETVDAIVNMLLEIPPSGDDLRKIIDIVEDIACQTNSLAVSLVSKRPVPGNPLSEMR
jgi:hypothetical protein